MFASRNAQKSPADEDVATPFGTTGHANETFIVTGSGPDRCRVKASPNEVLEEDKLLKKAILATPKTPAGDDSETKNRDLSLHHIESIKVPSGFGSPVAP